jgi:hypothetical protein
MNPEGALDLEQVKSQTQKVVRTVRRAELHSDLIVCSPSTGQFLENTFINWFQIGMPTHHTDLGLPKILQLSSKETFKIAHAPSRPKCKGTYEIKQAIENLQKQGLKIEFHLLTNMPNSVVQQTLRQMDLVVDELYSDTFMGGLGAEAAAAGIPFLTFGYAENELSDWSSAPSQLMVGYSNPLELERKIKWAIEDTVGRKSLAEIQMTFRRDQWSNKVIAERFHALALRSFPDSWIFCPEDVEYIWGFGMSKETLKSGLNLYLQKFGEAALYLEPKSKFKSKLENFLQ